MSSGRRRSRVEDDDSLLASVAGVPLTRSARIGACLVWAGFWCARILLTDALPYINGGQLRAALLELLGENAFDQGFSICMAWLTVEVAVIVWNFHQSWGRSMLIAKIDAKPISGAAGRERVPLEAIGGPLWRESAKKSRKDSGSQSGIERA